MKNGVMSMMVISKLVTGEIREGGNQLVFWFGFDNGGNTIYIRNTKV